jgi:hypothetical protein
LKALRLLRGERVVAVVPENCAGGGWSNSVVWVHISDHLGNIRTECLQPDEQTPEMRTLFDAGAMMHQALVKAVPVVVETAE